MGGNNMKKLFILMFIILLSCESGENGEDRTVYIENTSTDTEEKESETSIWLHSGLYTDIQHGSIYEYPPCTVPSQGVEVIFTFINNGTEPIVIENIEITNNVDYELILRDFLILPFIIQPYQNKVFSVHFGPQTTGTRISDVIITSDDLKYPEFTFILNGEGI
jgi:hypothetical protein